MHLQGVPTTTITPSEDVKQQNDWVRLDKTTNLLTSSNNSLPVGIQEYLPQRQVQRIPTQQNSRRTRSGNLRTSGTQTGRGSPRQQISTRDGFRPTSKRPRGDSGLLGYCGSSSKEISSGEIGDSSRSKEKGEKTKTREDIKQRETRDSRSGETDIQRQTQQPGVRGGNGGI